MRVIVCGAGRVGFGIASRLAGENADVTIIDQSPELIQNISEQLDVRGLVGHGAHPDVLDDAGAGEADMLIAVTFSDEVNMTACQVGHSLFNVPTKIARVRAQSYLAREWSDLFSRKNLPIDVIISPEREVARAVLNRLSVPGAFETIEFGDGRIQFVGVRIDQNCPVVNTPLYQLSELFPDLKARIVGIWRQNHLIVPKRSDQVIVGDEVYFLAQRDHVTRTLDILGHEERAARRIMLLGGGNIGLYVAQQLEKSQMRVNVKVIEQAKARAEEVAETLTRTVVLHGSGLDQTILREAGANETETMVALTDEDQVNILASVIAKKEGVERTLALINNRTYAELMQPLGIDAFIDPRGTTVSTILQHVRRGRIRALHSVRNGVAEALEAEALETSPLVNTPLKEARIPDGLIIGPLIRDDEIIIPRGDTEIKPHDRVTVFALRELVPKVEQLFRVSIEYF